MKKDKPITLSFEDITPGTFRTFAEEIASSSDTLRIVLTAGKSILKANEEEKAYCLECQQVIPLSRYLAHLAGKKHGKNWEKIWGKERDLCEKTEEL